MTAVGAAVVGITGGGDRGGRGRFPVGRRVGFTVGTASAKQTLQLL